MLYVVKVVKLKCIQIHGKDGKIKKNIWYIIKIQNYVIKKVYTCKIEK